MLCGRRQDSQMNVVGPIYTHSTGLGTRLLHKGLHCVLSQRKRGMKELWERGRMSDRCLCRNMTSEERRQYTSCINVRSLYPITVFSVVLLV